MTNPSVYPEPTTNVEVNQTQMSLVFITDDYVYKIKKPVNLGYLDYSTLARRQYYCEREVSLNRRLCPDVYLKVVKITAKAGKISLEDHGEVIEYAVKMRRLPRERMLDVLLANGKATPEMMRQVAGIVAVFHQKAVSDEKTGECGRIETIIYNTEENFFQTQKYIGQVFDRKQYDRLAVYTRSFIKNNSALLEQRVIENKIKDCHGDLHAQHICFTDHGIYIYDCIEFNDRFRYVDVAAEVAFLAMDLDRWARPDLSRQFVAAYLEKSADAGIEKMLNFYKCYFAYVRAKVNCFKMEAPLVDAADKERARGEAQQYFALAEHYIE